MVVVGEQERCKAHSKGSMHDKARRGEFSRGRLTRPLPCLTPTFVFRLVSAPTAEGLRGFGFGAGPKLTSGGRRLRRLTATLVPVMFS